MFFSYRYQLPLQGLDKQDYSTPRGSQGDVRGPQQQPDYRHKKPPRDLQELADFYRNGHNMPSRPPPEVPRSQSPSIPRGGKLPSLF